MDCIVHGVTKSQTQLSDFHFKKQEGYYISDACIGCGSCAAVCPQSCIITDSVPHVIEQEHCLHCGNCLEACPVGAVERR